MTLDAVEFLRRFLLHVLPRGFKRLRHYGLCAHGVRAVTLPLCRRVLGQASLPPLAINAASDAATPVSPRPLRADVCPACHIGQMQVQDAWFPQRTALDSSRRMLIFDTS
jgi:hypothetical protein